MDAPCWAVPRELEEGAAGMVGVPIVRGAAAVGRGALDIGRATGVRGAWEVNRRWSLSSQRARRNCRNEFKTWASGTAVWDGPSAAVGRQVLP